MPIYDFVCLACKTAFSKMVLFQDRHCTTCPNCGASTQRKFTTSNQPLDVKVTGDRYHGVQTKKGLNEIMEKRAQERYVQEGAAEVRERFGADCVVEDKNPKAKQVVTK